MTTEYQSCKFEPFFLTAKHQVAIGLLLSAGFLGGIAYFGLLRFEVGRLADIDDASAQVATYQVDLNLAQWPELVVLPGIGETLAQLIVEHRQQVGNFRHHQELLDIRGIGDMKLAALQPHLLPIGKSD